VLAQHPLQLLPWGGASPELRGKPPAPLCGAYSSGRAQGESTLFKECGKKGKKDVMKELEDVRVRKCLRRVFLRVRRA